MAQWTVDPGACKLKGFNATVMVKSDQVQQEERWVTQDMLAGPRFLSNANHAQVLVDSGELNSRKCRYAALAALGVMEYYITDELFVQLAGTRQEAGVSAETGITADQFQAVKDSMDKGVARPAKRAKTTKVPSLPDPEMAALKEANTRRTTSLRQLKRATDATENDVSSMLLGTPKMAKKPPRSHAGIP